MNGYDVIGDVHGHADRLESLLRQLDYDRVDGLWRHPKDRTAVFIGDLIDRGCGQLRVLRIVRSMVDAGTAHVVMGNHEFNAIAYATVDPKRLEYCRPHSEKNNDQHSGFLTEVGFGTPLHAEIILWFRMFPLWFERDGLRVVHACWSATDIDHLRSVLTNGCVLNDQAVIDATTKDSRTYDAIEHVLEGPEIDMGGACYDDKGGHRRDKARARWWDPEALTLAAAAEIPGGAQLHDASGAPVRQLPNVELPPGAVPRYTEDTPVIYGHYWRTGERVLDPSERTACVDYSAGKGGPLVAYRWDGESTLDERKFEAA